MMGRLRDKMEAKNIHRQKCGCLVVLFFRLPRKAVVGALPKPFAFKTGMRWEGIIAGDFF
jgi:hypothetical protein